MNDIADELLLKDEADQGDKIAQVIGFFDSGGVKVKFDGEDQPSQKEYPYLRSYMPLLGDRVFMKRIGDSYIIFDAIEYKKRPGDLRVSNLTVTGRSNLSDTSITASDSNTGYALNVNSVNGAGLNVSSNDSFISIKSSGQINTSGSMHAETWIQSRGNVLAKDFIKQV